MMIQEGMKILELFLASACGIGLLGNILHILYCKKHEKDKWKDTPSYEEWRRSQEE